MKAPYLGFDRGRSKCRPSLLLKSATRSRNVDKCSWQMAVETTGWYKIWDEPAVRQACKIKRYNQVLTENLSGISGRTCHHHPQRR